MAGFNCECTLNTQKLERNHSLRIYAYAIIKYAICLQDPKTQLFYHTIRTGPTVSAISL